MVTPISTILRAVTGAVTLYMVNAGVAKVWLTVSTKEIMVMEDFAKVIGVIALVFIINTLPSNNKQQLAVKSANYSTHTYTCTPSPVKKNAW